MSGLQIDCEYTYPTGFTLQVNFETTSTVTALFGPSGSGKTTILRLIAGLLRPRKGFIRLRDRTLDDVVGKVHVPPEGRDIGLVFQDLCLFPHMNVRKNLEYGMRRPTRRRGNFDEIVELLDIAPLLDRAPHLLSGGERQRVALGRALLRSPKLLLLDEPLAALDQPLQERILDYLKRVLRQYQIPTILVTHDRAHVEALTTSVVHVCGGQVHVPESG